MWPRMRLGMGEALTKKLMDCQKVLKKDEIIRILQTGTDGCELVYIAFHNNYMTEEDVIEILKVYFSQVVDSSIRSRNTEEVWFMAVERRMKRVVEFLLKKFKYTIDKCDEKGNSIAHLLVNSEEKFFHLLTPDNHQPLKSDNEILRIENASANFVEWLMDKGLDFDRQNEAGKTALNLSIEFNLQHISRVLMKYTQNIHQYLDQNNRSLLHLFLETHAKYRDKSSGNAFKAERYNDYSLRYTDKCVKLLLDKGLSALAYNCWDQTPLYMAVKENESMSIIEMMIRHLLKKANNVATTTFVELVKSCAWWRGWTTEHFLYILRELAFKGADVNAKGANGTTPLYWAFHGQNRRAVDVLNDYDADFSVLTENNENLLHALSKRLDPTLVPDEDAQQALFQLLLRRARVDLNAKTRSNGETPLHFASESGYLAVVRELIAHGAEVDCKNTSGETPLHLAVHGNAAVRVAMALLDSKADVNSKDDCGRWPLYLASTSEQRLLLVPVLLKWGAHVNAQIAGESPFSRAVRHCCHRNAEEMLAYGADISEDRVVSWLPSLKERNSDFHGLLVQHSIKLDAAGLPVSREYANIAAQLADHQRLRGNCAKEVEKLKKTFINDRTSFYHFLHMNFARRRVLSYDETFKTRVESPTLEREFPMYAVVILASYRETVVWKTLLEPAERAWLKLTEMRIPIECLEKIFAYVSNADLLGMIGYAENA